MSLLAFLSAHRVVNSFLGVTALAALASGGHQIRSNGGGSGPSNVIVVNSAGQPVPTAAQGTTMVSGTVSLANGTSVAVSSLPAVQVSSLPAVQISNGGNNPVPIADAGAVTFYRQIVHVDKFGFATAGPFDTSHFQKIRVMLLPNGALDYSASVRLIDPGDPLAVLVMESLTGKATQVYELPGQQIDMFLVGSNFGPTDVTVVVYGR